MLGTQFVQILNVHDHIVPQLNVILLSLLHFKFEDASLGFYTGLMTQKLYENDLRHW